MLNFLKYNNAVPIALGVIFLGSASAFAATDPQAILNSQQQVLSVDNTYIAHKDLVQWSPQVSITAVTEDTENYYVAYTFTTIDVKDYVWQDVSKPETMTVSKADLGPYGDLGVYVTRQFKNIIGNELSYLTEVQSKARAQTSQKTVATIYGGLIGKLLNDKTETLPGYTPVVVAPPQHYGGIEGSAGESAAAALAGGAQGGSGGSAPAGGTRMTLQLMGNNPAQVPIGAAYADLGVYVFDPFSINLGYKTYVDGNETSSVVIDTSTTTAHIVEYKLSDPSGAQLVVRRVVLVGSAADPGGEVNTAGNIVTITPQPPPAATPTPAPTPTPEPEPTPEPTPTAPESTSTGVDQNASTTDQTPPATTSSDSSATGDTASTTP